MDAEVVSVAVGETAFGTRGFVALRPHDGSTYRFATIDLSSPFKPQAIVTVDLELGGETIGWASRIALATVSGRQLALVVGGISGQGRLGVVDVTDPTNPVVQAIVDLQGSWGGSVTVDAENTVYVGTTEGLEAYSVVDAAAPKLVGAFPDLVNEAVLANGLAVAAGNEGGLTVLEVEDRLRLHLTDFIVVDNDYKSVDDVTSFVAGVPADFEVRTAEILLYEEDVVVTPLTPNPQSDGSWLANVRKELQLPRPPPTPPAPEFPQAGEPPPPAPPPPPPSTARLVLNRDLPDERASTDLYGAEPWVRPLLRVEGETRRVSETGVPIVRTKLDFEAETEPPCDVKTSNGRLGLTTGGHTRSV